MYHFVGGVDGGLGEGWACLTIYYLRSQRNMTKCRVKTIISFLPFIRELFRILPRYHTLHRLPPSLQKSRHSIQFLRLRRAFRLPMARLRLSRLTGHLRRKNSLFFRFLGVLRLVEHGTTGNVLVKVGVVFSSGLLFLLLPHRYCVLRLLFCLDYASPGWCDYFA